MKRIEDAKLLDILARERMETALEAALEKDGEYQHELAEQKAAFGRMEETGLDGGQELAVDGAISATNSCGTAYGMAAYRLGLKDGLRIAHELGETA